MPWSTRLEDPITPPAGGVITTLQDAADFILALPKKLSATDPWQTAMHCLIEAAEDRGPLMHARIAMLRAINAGRPAPARPRKRAKAYRVIGSNKPAKDPARA